MTELVGCYVDIDLNYKGNRVLESQGKAKIYEKFLTSRLRLNVFVWIT